MYLPCTCTVILCTAEGETPLVNSQIYSPSSEGWTLFSFKPPSSHSVLSFGNEPITRLHVTCGGGLPTALHSSVTLVPTTKH